MNKDPRSVEQPLEHTSIHAEFCALFEDLFTDFLARNSVSVPEFYNLLKQEQAQARRGHGQLPISATFGNVLLSVTDFFNFCEMMYEVETGSEVIFCPPLVLVDDMVESAPKLDDWDRVEVQAKVEEKGFYSPAKVTAKSSYK